MSRALGDVLADRPYPGRGCLVWRSPRSVVLAYFLTGRSASSRARRLEALPAGDIEVADTSDGPPDALRHYAAAVRRGAWTVLGNGDHVTPLAEDLGRGVDASQAWRPHVYEPDPPIFTPRIWAARHADGTVLMGSVRRGAAGDDAPERTIWSPDVTRPGAGVLVTTYGGSTDEVRVSGTPADFDTTVTSADELLHDLWSRLDPGLRVAAFAVEAGASLGDALLLPAAPPR